MVDTNKTIIPSNIQNNSIYHTKINYYNILIMNIMHLF